MKQTKRSHAVPDERRGLDFQLETATEAQKAEREASKLQMNVLQGHISLDALIAGCTFHVIKLLRETGCTVGSKESGIRETDKGERERLSME